MTMFFDADADRAKNDFFFLPLDRITTAIDHTYTHHHDYIQKQIEWFIQQQQHLYPILVFILIHIFYVRFSFF